MHLLQQLGNRGAHYRLELHNDNRKPLDDSDA